ncbi:MAG: hypothetical protein ACKO41_01600, partial [Sphingomonadales bacterium]
QILMRTPDFLKAMFEYLVERRATMNDQIQVTQLIENGIQKKEILPIDSATAVLIMLHAIGGIESWHRSKKRISARELEDNMLTILVGGLRKNH